MMILKKKNNKVSSSGSVSAPSFSFLKNSFLSLNRISRGAWTRTAIREKPQEEQQEFFFIIISLVSFLNGLSWLQKKKKKVGCYWVKRVYCKAAVSNRWISTRCESKWWGTNDISQHKRFALFFIFCWKSSRHDFFQEHIISTSRKSVWQWSVKRGITSEDWLKNEISRLKWKPLLTLVHQIV